MAHRRDNDIQKAHDTAAGGAYGDPVTRKLKATLPGSGKYGGNQADTPQVIGVTTHIEGRNRDCLLPALKEAF